MCGFKAIPAKWVKRLPDIADKNFSFTNYSFNSIVASTMERVKRTVEHEGGRIEEGRVVIPLQKARKAKLEQFWAGKVIERVRFDDRRWNFQGPWEQVGKEDGYHRISQRSRSAGAQASVSFEGTGAVVVGALGNDGGYADIYLDGKRVTKVDAYNDDDRYNEGLWGKFDLKPGTHTVRIVVNGQPYPGSKDAWINLEDLIVYRK